MKKSIWDEFTNLYSLSKTLRFELRPHPKTKSLIDVIKQDREIDRLYNEEMKPMFDDLHEKFISEALKFVEFSIDDLEKLDAYYIKLKDLKQKLKNLNKNKEKNKKKIGEVEKKIKELENSKSGKIVKLQNDLRDIISKRFDDVGENWKKMYKDIETDLTDKKDKRIKIALKGSGVKVLEEENILALLAYFYPEKINAIKEFKGFFTYFKGFNQNRANYYVSDQKSTGIANRIININFNIFIKNKNDFELFFEKLPEQLAPYKNYFKFENYKKCLSQEGIDKYNDQVGEAKKIVNLEYNQIQTDKKNILKGLNKLQKQIGCKTRQQREQLEKGESLYPKYLEKIGRGFHITKNEQDNYQLWECLDYLNIQLKSKVENLRQNYQNFFINWQDYKLDEIWFRKESLNTISAKWFGGANWFILTKALAYLGTGKIENEEYKIPQFINLQELKEAMEALEKGVDFDLKKPRRKKKKEEKQEPSFMKNRESKQCVYKPENLFKDEYKELYQNQNLFEAFLTIWQIEIEQQFKKIETSLANFETAKRELFDKNKHTKIVFDLMQNGYLPLLQFTRYHSLEKKGEIIPGYNMEAKFYDILDAFWADNPINQYRTALQSTLTQKPYSKDKIKLNFDNPSLAKGWDINKEVERRAVILRNYLGTENQFGEKEYDYHLAVVNKRFEYPFNKKDLYGNSDQEWEKMEYKYLKDASLSIPKCSTQVKQVVNHFKDSNEDFILIKGSSVGKFTKPLKISKEIFEINNRIYFKEDCNKSVLRGEIGKKEEKKYIKSFQKEFLEISQNYNLYKKSLNNWINYCKEFLRCYPSCEYFDYSSLDDAGKYESVDLFYKDVDRLSYTKKFVPINFDEIEKLIEKGEIYLFQIYSKDFSKKRKDKKIGKDSLQTLILKNLFSANNLKERFIKLNGETGLFFRDKSMDIEKDESRSKTFDIIKHKRYTTEKYFFHFPLTINFGADNLGQKDFNQKILKHICQNQKSIQIIGIDRGEKHLMYYSRISIDENGNAKIEDQGSFNKIKTKDEMDVKKIIYKYKDEKEWTDKYIPSKKDNLEDIKLEPTGEKENYVDYHLLLDYYEKKRIIARKNWEVIGKIKDLKEGYISQVIHNIYKMILEHNALVVMEDLNSEFKNNRLALREKSIYKKFELDLARKLSHLILKDKNPSEIGGALRAYQLTPKIEAGKIEDFEKVKQWGALFYVQPHYTSTTDPLTGWRKHLYISNSATKKEFYKYFGLNRKIQINYDFDKTCCKFSYQDKTGKTWNLYAFKGLSRFYYDSKNRQVKSYDLFKEFEELFSDFDKNKSINEQISEQEKFQWKTLIFFWNLLNQIRNTDRSKQGNENDFLQSPIWSEEHQQFFDSRKVTNTAMPENGDANGAYNIARKGILLLSKIRKHAKADREFKRYPDLFISNSEWDKFAQSSITSTQ